MSATTRADFLSTAFLSLVSVSVVRPNAAMAAEGSDDVVTTATASSMSRPAGRTIRTCPRTLGGKANNCISTSSVKQINTYSPPWTFDVSAEEAFARIKGVVASDPLMSVTEMDEADKYMRVSVQSPNVSRPPMDMEFWVKVDDKVVTFRSSDVNLQPANDDDPDNTPVGGILSDFGANRSKLEDVRKKCAVFGVMGDSVNSADSYYGTAGEGGKGNGPLGQLKAFYGLNSGTGFEDVFEK
jgi:uncharacterized protein (DUF1499 family)